ncbi:hypothetical protein D3C81_584920 [compost metagenome]
MVGLFCKLKYTLGYIRTVIVIAKVIELFDDKGWRKYQAQKFNSQYVKLRGLLACT